MTRAPTDRLAALSAVALVHAAASAGPAAPPTHAIGAMTLDAGGSIQALALRDDLAPLAFSYQKGEAQPVSARTKAGEPTVAGAAAEGEPGDNEEARLAKLLANPIANLISVPFQYNYDHGFGPNNAGRSTLNIQPVIPFTIDKDWNLIVRTILPVIYSESPASGVSSDFGLGDTTQSFFLSPAEKLDGWIVGAGPAALWPTATSPQLGCGQVALGPTAVVLRQEHGWTYGMLANQLWAVSGSGDHERVSRTFLQPFLSYTWPTATTLTLDTESTYDWSASQWTVPINLEVAQLVRLGGLPVQLQLGGRYYAVTPEDGPEWGIRFTFTFLFPK